MNRYSIIIPSRNAENLTACASAIRAAGETAHLIVIDDGLDAGFFESGADRQMRPYVLLPGVQPFVFARNVNLGIRAVPNDDVVIMNDDALLHTPHGLTRLAADAAAHPEYGVIAASVDSCGTLNQIHRSPRGIAIEKLPEGLRVEKIMLAFICVYIPRRVIERVGYLDERFAVNAGASDGPRGYGCEDDDYCLRVRKAGYKLGVENDVVIDHTTLRSTFRHGARRADVRLHENVFREKYGHWPEGHGYPER